MVQTYSSAKREKADGRVYSSQPSSVTVLSTKGRPAEAPRSAAVRQGLPAMGHGLGMRPAAVGPVAASGVAGVSPTPGGALPATPTAATATSATAHPSQEPVHSITFALSSLGLPAASKIAPNGAAGWVNVRGRPGEPYTVSGAINGLRPMADPALRPVLWLIHDLIVPPDLDPRDLDLLPKGSSGYGNLPGALFTLDGNSPTYLPSCNTLSICISPGTFTLGDGTIWQVDGRIHVGTNQAFHPLVTLGPTALADIETPLPTGRVARILTDLFMRPATRRPELGLRTHFPQRLITLVQDATNGGDGADFVDPHRFTRASVSIEGVVRATPTLMPTRESTFLLALKPTV